MEKFEMVAKTLMGLEEVLAEELRSIGAENVEPGRRMVSFQGDKEMLYKANLCCRTALRILKPFYKFTAHTPDELYENAKEYNWGEMLSPDKTFCIDTVAYSDDFTHSHFVTYKIKDAIVDWFRDRYEDGRRPSVRLKDADIMINVHISNGNVTLSLDSSGKSLHHRGYRAASADAPISEVLAAGIILLSGWRGEQPFVDPMCGSGTFLVEAALIAANINPGIYRKSFAFQSWADYDQDLFEKLFYDDSAERDPQFPIIGADISPAAVEACKQNLRGARVAKWVDVSVKPLAHWEEAPKPAGVLVTNPPYGERIKAEDIEALYALLGNRLKFIFQGYHAWVISSREDCLQKIGLAPSQKFDMLNGQLECQLNEYIIFDGDKKSFLAKGGKLKDHKDEDEPRQRRDSKPRRFKDGDDRPPRRFKDGDDRPPRRFKDGDDRPPRRFKDGDDRPPRRFKDGDDRPPRRFKDGDDRSPRRFKDGDRDAKTERKVWRERKPSSDDSAASPETSENPLALRRNPKALRILQNRQPSLPKAEGPLMRSRTRKNK